MNNSVHGAGAVDDPTVILTQRTNPPGPRMDACDAADLIIRHPGADPQPQRPRDPAVRRRQADGLVEHRQFVVEPGAKPTERHPDEQPLVGGDVVTNVTQEISSLRETTRCHTG